MKLSSMAAAIALISGSFLALAVEAQDSPPADSAPAQSQGPSGAAPAPAAQRAVRPPKMPYGMPIRLAQAKQVAAAAEAAAVKANVKVAIAITDNNGELVYFEQLDDTSTGIRDIALQKARFAARYRMPTSYVGAMKRNGVDIFTAFPGAFPGPGGVTLTYDGRTVGGLGISGGADGAIADAGAAALGAPNGSGAPSAAESQVTPEPQAAPQTPAGQ